MITVSNVGRRVGVVLTPATAQIELRERERVRILVRQGGSESWLAYLYNFAWSILTIRSVAMGNVPTDYGGSA